MKKWVCNLAAWLTVISLCLFSGCSAGSLTRLPGLGAGDSLTVKVNLADKTEDKIQIRTAIPQFSGFQAAEELNAKIQKVSDDGIAQIKQDTQDLGDVPGAGSLYYQSYFDYTHNDDVLSVWVTSENYSGGAHGMSWVNAFTVNTKTGESYGTLGSLFKDPAAGVQYITDKIIKDIQKSPEGFFPEAIQTVKDKKGNYSFYVDGSDLVIYFDLYEITPYAAGMPMFRFPLKDLQTKPYFTEKDPPTGFKLNGQDIKFKEQVVSNDSGVFVPLEETAAALNDALVEEDGKFTVDGKSVEVTMINGAPYAPLMFFNGTLRDFVFYDGTTLRMFTQVEDIQVFAKAPGTASDMG